MLELLQYRAWALSENYYNQMYPVVSAMVRHGHSLNGIITKKTIEDYIPTLESLLSAEENIPHPNIHADDLQVTISRDQSSGLPVAQSGNKNIALIPIVGPLTKRGDLCSMGMQDYAMLLNKANASPTIDGIVFIMDTPGGTVDGTPELGLAIKNSAKPVGVFGDGMVASAGIWLASQASVIVGNKNNPTEFGSIGVLMGLPNYQNVIDAGNLPAMEIFRADQSTDKARINAIEPITEAGRASLQQSLNDTADAFIATVKAGRGDKLNTATEGLFSGRMFSTLKSKQAGLIDAVGTLQTAVNKVAELSRERMKQQSQGTTARKANANTEMKLPKLSALLGAAAALFTGSGPDAKEISLTAEQAAALETSEKKLTDSEADNAKLVADINAQKTKITELEATVTGLNTQVSALTGEKETLTASVATLTSEKAELQKKLDVKPTGTATTVIPGASEANQAADGETVVSKNKYLTSIDAQADELRKQNANNQTLK